MRTAKNCIQPVVVVVQQRLVEYQRRLDLSSLKQSENPMILELKVRRCIMRILMVLHNESSFFSCRIWIWPRGRWFTRALSPGKSTETRPLVRKHKQNAVRFKELGCGLKQNKWLLVRNWNLHSPHAVGCPPCRALHHPPGGHSGFTSETGRAPGPQTLRQESGQHHRHQEHFQPHHQAQHCLGSSSSNRWAAASFTSLV